MEYNFSAIERKWQEQWKTDKAYKVEMDEAKPKCYVLDMFPYPSGAGLHVGHPLGYIASDIYSRYKRLKGFNVLHPMGFDSFGLPAEQYALETGQHPADTTEKNIETFKAQLDKIGFCYDWDREIRTSDPSYYKWTQDIFLKLFEHYFCNTQKKARPISDLIKKYELKGCAHFTAEEWNAFSEKVKADWLMKRRLAYVSYGEVNWCEALGTVLANDEVVNGVSERGGHPVEKKKMRQWYLRITAYAERLLAGLDTVQFSESMKDMQRNWIGKSEGAELSFIVNETENIKVYTTRPDTIFGVDFLVLAPEHELVNKITTAGQQKEIDDYLHYVKSRSDRERMAEVKQITGCFTGAYATNPFDGKLIPIWIAEYVLAGYGTGAIMAVPCGDQRDFGFAKHFNIPITNIIGEHYTGEEANPTKEAVLQNSGFLNGMLMSDAIPFAMDKIEALGIGKRKINFRMRDAGFSRQRYWGEPFPIIWKDGIAIPLKENDLPLELPRVEKYGPGPDGEGPLANITDWVNVSSSNPPSGDEEASAANEDLIYIPNNISANMESAMIGDAMLINHISDEVMKHEEENDDEEASYSVIHSNPPLGGGGARETSTMPGYAGSSWYFLRYMDPHNADAFCDKEKSDYWQQVDLYIGGTEHAVGHLLYSRMWTKFLYDLDLISFDEPFKKLVNQGMITGKSALAKVIWLRSAHAAPHGVPVMHPYIIDYNFDTEKLKPYVNRQNTSFSGITEVRLPVEELPTNNNGEYYITGEVLGRIVKKYPQFGPSEKVGQRFSAYEILTQDTIENRYSQEPIFITSYSTNEEQIPNPFQTQTLGGGNIVLSTIEEKMSKTKLNTFDPDNLVKKYGADTFRMYEMFLGPVEMSKPWDTKGIEGVHRFLRKLWRLFFDEVKGPLWIDEKPTAAELKTLHKTIKKIDADTESFSYNTAVSAFMVCVNELSDLKCHKKEILQPLLVLLSPYAPHIAEELWHATSAPSSVLVASYPVLDESHLAESTKDYPVSINGKMRTTITLPSEVSAADAEAAALGNDVVQKWLEGKTPKKVIFVKGKMVNVVV